MRVEEVWPKVAILCRSRSSHADEGDEVGRRLVGGREVHSQLGRDDGRRVERPQREVERLRGRGGELALCGRERREGECTRCEAGEEGERPVRSCPRVSRCGGSRSHGGRARVEVVEGRRASCVLASCARRAGPEDEGGRTESERPVLTGSAPGNRVASRRANRGWDGPPHFRIQRCGCAFTSLLLVLQQQCTLVGRAQRQGAERRVRCATQVSRKEQGARSSRPRTRSKRDCTARAGPASVVLNQARTGGGDEGGRGSGASRAR